MDFLVNYGRYVVTPFYWISVGALPVCVLAIIYIAVQKIRKGDTGNAPPSGQSPEKKRWFLTAFLVITALWALPGVILQILLEGSSDNGLAVLGLYWFVIGGFSYVIVIGALIVAKMSTSIGARTASASAWSGSSHSGFLGPLLNIVLIGFTCVGAVYARFSYPPSLWTRALGMWTFPLGMLFFGIVGAVFVSRSVGLREPVKNTFVAWLISMICVGVLLALAVI